MIKSSSSFFCCSDTKTSGEGEPHHHIDTQPQRQRQRQRPVGDRLRCHKQHTEPCFQSTNELHAPRSPRRPRRGAQGACWLARVLASRRHIRHIRHIRRGADGACRLARGLASANAYAVIRPLRYAVWRSSIWLKQRLGSRAHEARIPRIIVSDMPVQKLQTISLN
jgi:hypothetical protein